MTKLRGAAIMAAFGVMLVSFPLAAAVAPPSGADRAPDASVSRTDTLPLRTPSERRGTAADLAAEIANDADQWSRSLGGEIGLIAPQEDGSVLVQLVDGAERAMSIDVDGVVVHVAAGASEGGALGLSVPVSFDPAAVDDLALQIAMSGHPMLTAQVAARQFGLRAGGVAELQSR